MSKIIDGKCIICGHMGRVFETNEEHKLGLCEVDFAGIEDLTASNLMESILGRQ